MHVIDGEEIRALSARLGPFSTRGGPFRLLLPPTCPPASTAPGGGLHGDLLEGLCGRRRRRCMPNRLNVGTFMPASDHQTLVRSFEVGVQKRIVHT